jgi:hypothetical protein
MEIKKMVTGFTHTFVPLLELVKHQNIIDIRMIDATPRRPFSKVYFPWSAFISFFVENITI